MVNNNKNAIRQLNKSLSLLIKLTENQIGLITAHIGQRG